MTEIKPKRRWFQFSLRTFLIAVTLFGGWIGWNLHEVRQRKQALEFIVLRKGTVSVYSNNDVMEREPPWRASKLPWMWRMLGSEPIRKIDLGMNLSGFDAQTITAWFPESEIEWWDGKQTRRNY